MNLSFFKMQAQGNDYLYFDFRDIEVPDIDFPELSRQICDRHFGVGADGIVLILPSSSLDAYMRILNADGSEAEMCGSALRSVCGYLGVTEENTPHRIDTLAGIKTGYTYLEKGRMKARVDMGSPTLLQSNLHIAGFTGSYIDMGNPHFVIFVEHLPGIHIAEYSNKILSTKHFSNGVNVEFVRIDESTRFSVQVWERGSGATLACGTGACAVAFAGYQTQRCGNKLQIDLPGGFVETEYDPHSQHIFLTGEVVHVFQGVYEW